MKRAAKTTSQVHEPKDNRDRPIGLEKYFQPNGLREKMQPIIDATVERLSSLRTIAEKHDLDGNLFSAVIDGDLVATVNLANTLAKLLNDRERRQKSGATHQIRRGNAISDVTVNYLISECLTSSAENGQPIPVELVNLVKRQLGVTAAPAGAKMARLKREREFDAAASQLVKEGQTPTIRKIAAKLGVEPSTVSRWFPNKEAMRSRLDRWGEIAAKLKKPSRLDRRGQR